jgi:hypothetical protein
MIVENPYFYVEPDNGVPFNFMRSKKADAIIRATINGKECDVYISVRDDWKLVGVLSQFDGIRYDEKELREKLITHPNLRIQYITGVY